MLLSERIETRSYATLDPCPFRPSGATAPARTEPWAFNRATPPGDTGYARAVSRRRPVTGGCAAPTAVVAPAPPAHCHRPEPPMDSAPVSLSAEGEAAARTAAADRGRLRARISVRRRGPPGRPTRTASRKTRCQTWRAELLFPVGMRAPIYELEAGRATTCHRECGRADAVVAHHPEVVRFVDMVQLARVRLSVSE